jgi:hypothetical protein
MMVLLAVFALSGAFVFYADVEAIVWYIKLARNGDVISYSAPATPISFMIARAIVVACAVSLALHRLIMRV